MYLSVGTLKSQHNYSSPIKFNLQPILHLTGSRQGAEWDGAETGWLFGTRQQSMTWRGRQSWVLPEDSSLAGGEPCVKDSASDPRPSTFCCVSQVASYQWATSGAGMMCSILEQDQPPGVGGGGEHNPGVHRLKTQGALTRRQGKPWGNVQLLPFVSRWHRTSSSGWSPQAQACRVIHSGSSFSWPSRSYLLSPGIIHQEKPRPQL